MVKALRSFLQEKQIFHWGKKVNKKLSLFSLGLRSDLFHRLPEIEVLHQALTDLSLFSLRSNLKNFSN